MPIKTVSVENALITTATVEVKTLTLSGKQVTLSVFRQIPESALIDKESLELRGPAWGWVNYHPDKCADDAHHIHVVWQSGSALLRSAAYASPQWAPESKLHLDRLAYQYAMSLIGAACVEALSVAQEGADVIYIGLNDSLVGALLKGWRYSSVGLLYGSVEYDGQMYRFSMAANLGSFPGRSETANILNFLWREWDYCGSPTPRVCAASLDRAIAVNAAYFAKYGELYKSLCGLDQLYIAV